MRTVKPTFGDGIRERFAWAATVRAEDVAEAQRLRDAVIERLRQAIGLGDILCLPTSPRIAPLRNTPTDAVEITYRHHAMCLLCVAGLGGLPQVSLPLATLDGCPLGLSILGPRGADLQLLRLARTLMAACGRPEA